MALPELCYEGCPCSGEHLDKLVQPAMLALLEEEDLHGYLLVQRLAEMPLFHGRPPDPSGVYRYLKQMEERGLVTSTWGASPTGPAKRLYRLTEEGRGCLCQWIATLRRYDEAIREFLSLVQNASPGA